MTALFACGDSKTWIVLKLRALMPMQKFPQCITLMVTETRESGRMRTMTTMMRTMTMMTTLRRAQRATTPAKSSTEVKQRSKMS